MRHKSLRYQSIIITWARTTARMPDGRSLEVHLLSITKWVTTLGAAGAGGMEVIVVPGLQNLTNQTLILAILTNRSSTSPCHWWTCDSRCSGPQTSRDNLFHSKVCPHDPCTLKIMNEWSGFRILTNQKPTSMQKDVTSCTLEAPNMILFVQSNQSLPIPQLTATPCKY